MNVVTILGAVDGGGGKSVAEIVFIGRGVATDGRLSTANKLKSRSTASVPRIGPFAYLRDVLSAGSTHLARERLYHP